MSDKLINGVKDDPATKDVDETFLGYRDLAKIYREENRLAVDAEIPADAVTRSGSGLDPEISPANAELQAARVARERGVSLELVRRVIADNTSGRWAGFSGEPRVNVLRANLALDQLK
jgi:K+-transporting ATPase ATPase C chain